MFNFFKWLFRLGRKQKTWDIEAAINLTAAKMSADLDSLALKRERSALRTLLVQHVNRIGWDLFPNDLVMNIDQLPLEKLKEYATQYGLS